MAKVQLRTLCHSRAGDKGDIANIALIVYDPKDYELVREEVTAQKVKDYFKGIAHGEVQRYELPTIGALNFVLDQALGGGVTRSLAVDGHGKSLSSYLLSMDIEVGNKAR